MKMFLIAMSIAAAVIAAAKVGQEKIPVVKKMNLPVIKLPFVKVDTPSITQVDAIPAPNSGSVAGTMTKMEGVVKTLTALKNQSAKTASDLILSTPSSDKEIIDVSKVVSQIAGQVEGIPSHVLADAKIEYCKRVIEEASKAGKLN